MNQFNPEILKILRDGTRDERVYICGQDFKYFFLYYFTGYITHDFADFHFDFFDDANDLSNKEIDEAAWVAFRESAKTSIAKGFYTWIGLYKKRQYCTYDSYEKENAELALFDIANTFSTNKKIIADFGQIYTETRKKGDSLKLKRMGNFVTSNGVKYEAFSTQESARGRVFDWKGKSIRPGIAILDDFETNKTIESYRMMSKIKKHIEEMKSGMGTDGVMLFLGNYITDDGVVNWILEGDDDTLGVKHNPRGRARVINVMDEEGDPTWKAKYVKTDAQASKINAEKKNRREFVVSIESKKRTLGKRVFETEMMNNPEESGQYFFDRRIIRRLMKNAEEPIKEVGDLKIWKKFVAHHRFGIGGDVAHGKGLDSCASGIIDYTRTPALVVATYEDNTIPADSFGHELIRQGEMYGECIIAAENNDAGYATNSVLSQNYDGDVYTTERKNKAKNIESFEYGFRSTKKTRPDVLYQFKDAVEEGHLEILDLSLLKELYYFKKRDMYILKPEEGMTRHFDKLMATAIAWEMRNHARLSRKDKRGNKKTVISKKLKLDEPYQP